MLHLPRGGVVPKWRCFLNITRNPEASRFAYLPRESDFKGVSQVWRPPKPPA